MEGSNPNNNPRIIVIQKLYGYYLNKSSNIEIQKHRYKKFIKDTISGTIEREELLLENLKTILQKEFNPSRTDLILKLMILSATYELMFSHKTHINSAQGNDLHIQSWALLVCQKSVFLKFLLFC